jgi:hypothetical protein
MNPAATRRGRTTNARGLHPDELGPSRRARPDRHGGPWYAEVLRHQRDELAVGLAVDRW